MPIEIRLLAVAIVLGIVQVVLAAFAGVPQRGGLGYAMGARDEPQPPAKGVAGRLDRTSKNFLETFPFFAAAVLAAVAIDRHNGYVVYGAHLYTWGRVAYLPIYAAGVPLVRTLVWGAAMAGIALVLIGLFAGAGAPA